MQGGCPVDTLPLQGTTASPSSELFDKIDACFYASLRYQLTKIK